MNGKGSGRRPGKPGAYEEGWDRVFSKNPTVEASAQKWLKQQLERVKIALKHHQYACITKGKVLSKKEV